jgi:hypothetical protein
MPERQRPTLDANGEAPYHPPSISEYASIAPQSSDQNEEDSDHDSATAFSSISASVLAHVVDVHCHPTDSGIEDEVLRSISHKICAMATRESDQDLVAKLAQDYPDKVIPCFGDYISRLRGRLTERWIGGR